MNSGITVLMIEDNPNDSELIREMLAEAQLKNPYLPPISLTVAGCLAEGLPVLSRGGIDLVLLDLSLPDSDGLETLGEVRACRSDVPVVVMTGHNDEETAFEALCRGAQDYLVKGQVNAALLVRSIRYTMERYRTNERLEGYVQELWKNERRFRGITENLADGIAIVDNSGRIKYANLAAEALLCGPSQSLEGMPFGYPLVLGEAIEIEVTREGRQVASAEMQVVKMPWDDEMVYLVSLRDITEREYLQEQVKQLQKMEAVGRLASGVAHDFNNMLVAIMGYTEMLKTCFEQDGQPDGSGQEFVFEIERAAERAATLTGQLLSFSRRQDHEPRLMNINEVVSDLSKMLKRLIGEDIECRISLSESAGNVKTDPGQLEQVIMNLVVNARDAMPRGGKLTIETDNADLDENYTRLHPDVRPGSYVMLAVSDTGCGMENAVTSRIFEPFFTTKGKGEGTGLGLSMIYGTVKQSKGHIIVYSEVGEGTTFKIYLPRFDESSLQVHENANSVTTLTGSETILVVEDELSIRRLVKRGLPRYGYTVLTARDSSEALDQLEGAEHSIDMLLTDVVLPGASGKEVSEMIRARCPDIKVLFMSGYPNQAVIHQGRVEPGMDFIHKPFTMDILAGKIRTVIDSARDGTGSEVSCVE